MEEDKKQKLITSISVALPLFAILYLIFTLRNETFTPQSPSSKGIKQEDEETFDFEEFLKV